MDKLYLDRLRIALNEQDWEMVRQVFIAAGGDATKLAGRRLQPIPFMPTTITQHRRTA